MTENRRYILETEAGEDVLGGPVAEGNVYINAYAFYPTNRLPESLAVGERTQCKVSLSRETGTYYVRRIN